MQVYVMMIVISGTGKFAGVSVMISVWYLSMYGAPGYRSSSFTILVNLSDALDPISNTFSYRSMYRPLKSVSALISGPWALVSFFLPLYQFVLDACPLLLSVNPFKSFPLGYQYGLLYTIPFTFSYSYFEFKNCMS